MRASNKILKWLNKTSWFSNVVYGLYFMQRPALEGISKEYSSKGGAIFPKKYDRAIALGYLYRALVRIETPGADARLITEDAYAILRLCPQERDLVESAVEVLARYQSGMKEFEKVVNQDSFRTYPVVNKCLALSALKRNDVARIREIVGDMIRLGQTGLIKEIYGFTPYLPDMSRSRWEVYEYLKDYGALESFLEDLKNNDYCIVGNSPCELGQKKGKQIDGHCKVIRFNYFSMDKKYIPDYGVKTSVWVRNASIQCGFPEEKSLEYVIFSGNLMMDPMPERIARILPQLIKTSKVGYFDGHPYIEELKARSGIKKLSLGLILLYFMYRMKGGLKREDVFGFAFVDQLKKGARAHYFVNRKSLKVNNHEWEREKDFFERMISSEIPPLTH